MVACTSQTLSIALDKAELWLELPSHPRATHPHDLGAETGALGALFGPNRHCVPAGGDRDSVHPHHPFNQVGTFQKSVHDQTEWVSLFSTNVGVPFLHDQTEWVSPFSLPLSLFPFLSPFSRWVSPFSHPLSRNGVGVPFLGPFSRDAHPLVVACYSSSVKKMSSSAISGMPVTSTRIRPRAPCTTPGGMWTSEPFRTACSWPSNTTTPSPSST